MARNIDTLHSGFKLIQDDRFFKLGQDSFLLSEFVNVKSKDKICDLGLGNGAISVLLYAKNKNISIDGVEIQDEVANLAKENAKINDISLNVILGDASKAKEFLKSEYYDIVVSNPPYFKEDSGFITESAHKKIARVEKGFDLESLCKSAKSILKYGGRLFVVQKPERTSDIFRFMFASGIEPKRMRYIHSTKNSKPSAVLVEGKKGGKSGIIIEPPLITRNDDFTYTEELLKMYRLG